jgi:AraC-like DNA-binding protein
MFFGDELCVQISPDLDLDQLSRKSLGELFKNASRISRFDSAEDHSFFQDVRNLGFQGLLCYRIDADRAMEIDDAIIRTPIAIRNQVSDLISFQFVSTVKRSEFLGKRKHVHDLGPALIVSAIPKKETTYRVPKTNVTIRHVVVHTTLSTLLKRIGEAREAYPEWLLEMIDGRHGKPRQRVFFLEEVHRDAIWSCFHLPVSGTLLGHWMCAKFDELLCAALQILKNSQSLSDHGPMDLDLPYGEKIRKARTILNMEYANPPALPTLAQQLGISETQLKSGFKTLNGITVMQYCIGKRMEAAKLLLRENRHSISEIADIVGYEDHSAFSRAFRRINECSPKEWRYSRQG